MERPLIDPLHTPPLAYSASHFLTSLFLSLSLQLVYSIISLMNVYDAVQSHASAAIVGVFLISLSVVAGLGLCSLLQLPFNATTTQIVPFLALGLGVDDMFLMAYAFAENSLTNHIAYKVQVTQSGSANKYTIMYDSWFYEILRLNCSLP